MLGQLGILKTGEWELMDTCRMVGKKSKEHSPIKDKIVYRAQEFTQHMAGEFIENKVKSQK